MSNTSNEFNSKLKSNLDLELERRDAMQVCNKVLNIPNKDRRVETERLAIMIAIASIKGAALANKTIDQIKFPGGNQEYKGGPPDRYHIRSSILAILSNDELVRMTMCEYDDCIDIFWFTKAIWESLEFEFDGCKSTVLKYKEAVKNTQRNDCYEDFVNADMESQGRHLNYASEYLQDVEQQLSENAVKFLLSKGATGKFIGLCFKIANVLELLRWDHGCTRKDILYFVQVGDIINFLCRKFDAYGEDKGTIPIEEYFPAEIVAHLMLKNVDSPIRLRAGKHIMRRTDEIYKMKVAQAIVNFTSQLAIALNADSSTICEIAEKSRYPEWIQHNIKNFYSTAKSYDDSYEYLLNEIKDSTGYEVTEFIDYAGFFAGRYYCQSKIFDKHPMCNSSKWEELKDNFIGGETIFGEPIIDPAFTYRLSCLFEEGLDAQDAFIAALTAKTYILSDYVGLESIDMSDSGYDERDDEWANCPLEDIGEPNLAKLCKLEIECKAPIWLEALRKVHQKAYYYASMEGADEVIKNMGPLDIYGTHYGK